MLSLFATAALAVATQGTHQSELIKRVENAPSDVSAFIVRRVGCNHFMTEPRFNEERAAFLDKNVRKLRCHDLDRTDKALRRSYRDDPAVLQLLDETIEMGPW